MGHFSDFCKHKESFEINGREQESRNLLDILKTASVNHRTDVINFLHNLGIKDPKIRAALDELSKNKLNQFNQDDGNDKRDVIVPFAADQVSGT